MSRPVPAEVSIVVPTRGRAEQVEACVEAILRACAVSGARIGALVVVVNGPETDPMSIRIPDDSAIPIEVVQSAQPGASRARNLGTDLVDSEVVVFVDDDVLVDETWLDPLVAPLLGPELWPGVAAAVGPIRLDLVTARPAWLTPNVESWFSVLDLGRESRVLAADDYGWSANLAVRRDALRRIGGFDLDLGPGTRAGFGDDMDALDRLRADGGAVAYAARATVRHRIEPDRLRRRWVVRRGFREGFARVARDRRRRGGGFRAEPLRAAGFLVAAVLRGFPRLLRCLRDPVRRSSALVDQAAIRAMHLGAAIASCTRRRRPPGDPGPSVGEARPVLRYAAEGARSEPSR